MADQKISALTAASALDLSEPFPVVQSSTTKKATGTQLRTALKSPRPLFDHYTDVGNVTTGETDLYSDTIAAGQLAANGDKIRAFYGGIAVAHATATRQIKVYFGGTVLFDSSAVPNTNGGTYALNVEIIRVSASVIRTVVFGAAPAVVVLSPLPIPFGTYAEVTGLTLANANILKITGQAGSGGAASNDIVMKQSTVIFIPAA